MKAIIFDMDGVLVNTMPFHYEAMKAAVREATDIELDKRTARRDANKRNGPKDS